METAESALIARCMSHDQDAYGELFARYNRKMFNTAYRILGEESSAEDAMQEAMLNIYRGIKSFRGDAKISTWISRITINACLGMLRKGKGGKGASGKQFVDLDDSTARELPAELTPESDPLEHAKHQELKSLVRETFSRMSHKQGQVVRMHDLEGNTIQEIAAVIRVPVGTVKSRLFYGRQEFKEIFGALTGRSRASMPALSAMPALVQ
jgi:RNA polymerase sigma-70 factor (ECF subfamily)